VQQFCNCSLIFTESRKLHDQQQARRKVEAYRLGGRPDFFHRRRSRASTTGSLYGSAPAGTPSSCKSDTGLKRSATVDSNGRYTSARCRWASTPSSAA
jgi:hypothetical protein